MATINDFRDEVLDAIGPTGWCGDSISDDVGEQADAVCAGIVKAHAAARAMLAALEEVLSAVECSHYLRVESIARAAIAAAKAAGISPDKGA